MVLLGWNLDSMLRAEFSNQQEMISLFEPAYPSENVLNAIVNSDETRQLKRLRNAFGLPGYWLTPAMANKSCSPQSTSGNHAFAIRPRLSRDLNLGH